MQTIDEGVDLTPKQHAANARRAAELTGQVKPQRKTLAKAPSSEPPKRKVRPSNVRVARAAPNAMAEAPAAPKPVKARKPRAGKTQDMINLLSRPKGATIKDLIKVSGWNEQSLKWFMQATLGKKKGLKVVHEGEGAKRVYRIDVPEGV